MVQAAVVPGNYAWHAKVRIAGYKVPHFSAEAQQRQSGLEVKAPTVLDCAFVLRQASGIQGIPRPPAAYAHPRRNRCDRQQLEPKSRRDEQSQTTTDSGSRPPPQRYLPQ